MIDIFTSYLIRIFGIKTIHKLKKKLGRQSFDEVRLVYEMFKMSNITGTMIDVGAHRGSSLGLFAADAWKILAFEPDNQNRSYLLRAYGHSSNIIVDERAVSNEPKSNLPFFGSSVSSGISGLSKFHDSHHQTQTVEVTTLTDAVISYGIQKIDFLKIDTEGYDFFVLQGLDFNKFAPSVIVCEFENRKTEPLGYDACELYMYLRDNGYIVTISEWEPISEYGAAHRWANFTDDVQAINPLGWGNMIAFRPQPPYDMLTSSQIIKLKEKIFS
jgi:FkbM family methyltransferase